MRDIKKYAPAMPCYKCQHCTSIADNGSVTCGNKNGAISLIDKNCREFEPLAKKTWQDYDAAFMKVDHPSHYTQGGIECIDAIRESMTKRAFCGYCKGNVIKYLWRYKDKGGVEDLRKAKKYLEWLIEEEK